MPGTIRIAGAGLAGLAAALTLAKTGHSVEVYERKSRLLPSSGPHTEAVRNYRPVDALEELRAFGFDLHPFSVVRRTIRYSPHFRNVLHGPAHYLFLRGRDEITVDQLLFRRASSVGVKFHFGSALNPQEADIAATGPPARGFNLLGAGYIFSTEGSSLDLETAYGLFDNQIAPSGYLVITPGPTFHSIYSVSWKELRFDRLLSMTERAFEIPWIREILGVSKRLGTIHGKAHFKEDPIAESIRNGTLLAGESGGFQDAVAGFGFRYAVISGSLAARAIAEGQDYRDLLKGVFRNEFIDAFSLRKRLNRASNEDYDSMIASLGPEITLEDYVRRREPRGF